MGLLTVGDIGGKILLAVVGGGVTAGSAFALAARTRWLLRSRGERGRPRLAPLVGMASYVVALALGLAYVFDAWGAGMDAANRSWRWIGAPLFVAGYVFVVTDPRLLRTRDPVMEAIVSSVRARPHVAVSGCLLGAATWLILPINASFVAQPARFTVPILWTLALFAELTFAVVWGSRYGLAPIPVPGSRRGSVPAVLVQPALWGWLAGAAVTLLSMTTVAQFLAGR